LLIDIGGFTTDYLAMYTDGDIDYNLAHYLPVGIQNVVFDFEEKFWINNLEKIKLILLLLLESILRAIATGVFYGGGRLYS
jgi:hypothetical protein